MYIDIPNISKNSSQVHNSKYPILSIPYSSWCLPSNNSKPMAPEMKMNPDKKKIDTLLFLVNFLKNYNM